MTGLPFVIACHNILILYYRDWQDILLFIYYFFIEGTIYISCFVSIRSNDISSEDGHFDQHFVLHMLTIVSPINLTRPRIYCTAFLPNSASSFDVELH